MLIDLKLLRSRIGYAEWLKIRLLTTARVVSNSLDIAGLIGVGLLASLLGASPSYLQGIGFVSTLAFYGWTMESVAVFVAVCVTVLFLSKSLFSSWLNLATAKVVAQIESQLSAAILENFFFSKGRSGNQTRSDLSELQNRVMNSTQAISTYLSSRISLTAELSLLFAMVAIFLVVNPLAAVSIFLLLGGILLITNGIMNKKIRLHGSRQMEGIGESLRIIKELHGVSREVTASQQLKEWIADFAHSRNKASTSWAVLYAINTFPRYIIETALILGTLVFVGGILVFSDLESQAVTIGVFIAGGFRVTATLLPLQAALSQMRDGATRGKLALESLTYLPSFVSKEQNQERLNTYNVEPSIVVRGVSLRFEGASQNVIENVSFTIPALARVALTGPSGAGKSTLVDVLLGRLNPDCGQVLIGGLHPMDAQKNEAGFIGIVPQRPQLISGTLADNVALSRHGTLDFERIAQILEVVGLGKLIQEGDWKHRVLSPDNDDLSGGEIQRLGLARALYRNPKILILDEATSALDAETEARVTSLISGLAGKLTFLIIAHRLSTIQGCDSVIYLEDGRVLAQGSFQEVAEKIPSFANSIRLMSGISDIDQSAENSNEF